MLAATSFGRHSLLLLQHPVSGDTMLDKNMLCRVNVLHCYHATFVRTDPYETCVKARVCCDVLCRDPLQGAVRFSRKVAWTVVCWRWQVWRHTSA